MTPQAVLAILVLLELNARLAKQCDEAVATAEKWRDEQAKWRELCERATDNARRALEAAKSLEAECDRLRGGSAA